MKGMKWLDVITALKRTLAQRLPERSAQWGALLNALAAQVEPPGADVRVFEHIVEALRALLDSGGADSRTGDLDAQLTSVAQARPAWPAPTAPTPENPDALPLYSFGPNAAKEVAYLRLHLGLSVAYVYRHLSQHVGMQMPSDELLRCVALVTSPPPSRRAPRR